MAGALAALALSIRDVVRFDRRSLIWPSWKQLFGVGRRYSGYPIFGVPQGLIAAVSWNVLPLLLLHYSGVVSAGQYWLAYRLLIAPVALLNGSYRQATLPIMGREDSPSARRMARRHSLNLLLLAATAAAPVYLFGETFFAQPVDGLLQLALGLGERHLAVHHAGAGLVAQLLHHAGADSGHA